MKAIAFYFILFYFIFNCINIIAFIDYQDGLTFASSFLSNLKLFTLAEVQSYVFFEAVMSDE